MHALKLSALFLTAGLLAACNQGSAPEGEATPAAEAPVATAPAAAAAEAPQAPANVANLWNGGQPKALDIQVAHPNGTVLQLTSLTSQSGSTTIGMRVINGRTRDVDLNRWNTRQGYIVLDTGERLYLSPPVNNTRLSVPAGQTLEGELVFLGRLPPVRAATLVLNENAQTDSEHTTTPGFRIDLPVSAEGAAQ